jgi:acetylornithine deacetylase/succinyl-diaminopimelate desuccinylase-like protein
MLRFNRHSNLCLAAFSGSGAKTVIPAKVIGKFSLRLVPDQDPERIAKCVQAHVEREFKKVRSSHSICSVLAIFFAYVPDHFVRSSSTLQTRWK